jgi:hypothetical protein
LKYIVSLTTFVIVAAMLWAADGEEKSKGSFAEIQTFGNDSVQVYLHVELETNYGWLYQKSQAKAFTTSDKEGRHRVKVDKLCLTLIAHDSTTQCVEGDEMIIVKEKKKGVGVKKKFARIIAWTEGPALGPETMEMKP